VQFLLKWYPLWWDLQIEKNKEHRAKGKRAPEKNKKKGEGNYGQSEEFLRTWMRLQLMKAVKQVCIGSLSAICTEKKFCRRVENNRTDHLQIYGRKKHDDVEIWWLKQAYLHPSLNMTESVFKKDIDDDRHATIVLVDRTRLAEAEEGSGLSGGFDFNKLGTSDSLPTRPPPKAHTVGYGCIRGNLRSREWKR
jgi:hypothetical protein